MLRACSRVLQGRTDDLRLVLLNVGVRLHPRFQGHTELHFQRYCISVYPKLGGHTTGGRRMGPSCSGALVPSTPQFEVDHRLVVPSCYHIRVRIRFPARCGAQNYPVKIPSIDRRCRMMTMVIEQSPCWVCSFSNAASTFLPPIVLPYLGTH